MTDNMVKKLNYINRESVVDILDLERARAVMRSCVSLLKQTVEEVGVFISL